MLCCVGGVNTRQLLIGGVAVKDKESVSAAGTSRTKRTEQRGVKRGRDEVRVLLFWSSFVR